MRAGAEQLLDSRHRSQCPLVKDFHYIPEISHSLPAFDCLGISWEQTHKGIDWKLGAYQARLHALP